MKAPLFIESLPHTPSLAWAARPLASGARLAVIGRLRRSSLEVGCPSYGGQRAVGGGSRRLLASLVMRSSPGLPGRRVGALFLRSSSQTARLARVAAAEVGFSEGGVVVGPCLGKVAAPGQQVRAKSFGAGPTGTAEIQTPVRQSRRAATASSVQRSARWSRTGLPATVGAHQPPNPSVKGTCLRQAPYVER